MRTPLLLALLSPLAAAQDVALQNGTATFSQNSGANGPAHAIDDDFTVNNGWAILDWSVFDASDQTAVWETAQDQGAGELELTMHFLHGNPGHLLGRFRWSVTTDERSTFADGLHTGGDVAASWTVLTQAQLSIPAGMTATELPDGSILMGGSVPGQGVYVVTYDLPMGGVTGLRLEALSDPTLPKSGPGMFPGNGNFLLNELEVRRPVEVFTYYGCGVNPDDSLEALSGTPDLGAQVVFGLANPLGTQPAGSASIAAVSIAADPAFPCGTPLPGLGMGGPGAPGELLIDLFPGNFVQYLFGTPWGGPGTFAEVTLAIPNDPNLTGLGVFLQGALVDVTLSTGVAVGLTRAVRFDVGS